MPTARRVRKSTTKKPPAKKATSRSTSNKHERKQDALSPGDTVEYSLSTNITGRGRKEIWVRCAVTSTVRANENGESAQERVAGYVEDFLADKVDELS